MSESEMEQGPANVYYLCARVRRYWLNQKVVINKCILRVFHKNLNRPAMMTAFLV